MNSNLDIQKPYQTKSNDKVSFLKHIYNDFNELILISMLQTVSQKDRHHGTSGAKEGFCSIGRFSKK